MRRLLAAAAAFVLLFVVASGFARALSSSDFSGFDMGAKATAAQFAFDSPSLGIPAKPTGEMNLAYSEAKLQSGPSAYGLGSIAWPGQVAAALPVFLIGEIERNCMCDVPLDVPNYPVRAESFHPQGPPSATVDAGSTHMRSSAKENYAEGVSYVNQFVFPTVADMGNQSSMSSTGFDPQGAVSMAEATASDVSLAGGVITIDSVVSRVTARSNGQTGTLAGKTTVAGARVQGVGDVVIDSSGVHVADQGIGSAPVQQALNGVLNQLGISMELAEPVDTKQGPKATRVLGGLLIRMKSSTLEPLIAALPEPLQGQVRGQLTLDQIVTISLAPAAVTAGAAKAFVFEPPALPPPTTTTGTPPTTDVPNTTTVGAGGTTPGGGSAPATVPLASTPVKITYEGVPLWLVIGLVLLAFALSRPLTMAADKLLAARVGGTVCPYEED